MISMQGFVNSYNVLCAYYRVTISSVASISDMHMGLAGRYRIETNYKYFLELNFKIIN